LVADASENYGAAVHDLPIFRDPKFDASKNGVRFQSCLLTLHLRIPEIDLAGSEDCGALCAMEILRRLPGTSLKVSDSRPLIDYATAAPFAIGFLETALAIEDSSNGI
jgi:hypothetical protein